MDLSNYTNQIHKEIIEVLNYSKIMCYVNDNDYYKLFELLNKDHCGHMYRFEYIKDKDSHVTNLFYIENCDLQDIALWEVSNDLEWLEEYTLCDISFINDGFTLVESEKTFYEVCRSDN